MPKVPPSSFVYKATIKKASDDKLMRVRPEFRPIIDPKIKQVEQTTLTKKQTPPQSRQVEFKKRNPPLPIESTRKQNKLIAGFTIPKSGSSSLLSTDKFKYQRRSVDSSKVKT